MFKKDLQITPKKSIAISALEELRTKLFKKCHEDGDYNYYKKLEEDINDVQDAIEIIQFYRIERMCDDA